MEIDALSGNMILLRGALPFPDGAFMFGNKALPVIDADNITGSPNRNLVANVLNGDAVKCTVILDVEVSPHGSFLLIIGLVLQNRKWKQCGLLLSLKDRCTRTQLLGVFLCIPRYEFAPHDVVKLLERIDIQLLHRADDVSFNNAYVALYMAFILRPPDSRGLRNDTVVVKELNIPGVQDALLVEVLTIYRCSTVVRNNKRRGSAKEIEGIYMACIPGRHLLVKKSLTIKIATVWKCHDKDMDFHQLPGIRINEMAVVYNGPVISDHHSKKYREHGKIQQELEKETTP